MPAAVVAAGAEQPGRVGPEQAGVDRTRRDALRAHTIPSSRSAASSRRLEPEQRGQHLVGVLAEARRARRHVHRLADEARVGRLLAHRPGDRVVDRHQVAAGGEVGVGEHVGRGVRGRDGHVVLDARGLELRRGVRAGPVGDDPVDLVAARGAVGEACEPRVVDQVRPVHGLAQPGEVGVRPGDDADVLAVGGGVVVERRAVREPVALAAAHDAEPVVGGDRPLEDPQRGAVQRGVDDRALARRGGRHARTARRSRPARRRRRSGSRRS